MTHGSSSFTQTQNLTPVPIGVSESTNAHPNLKCLQNHTNHIDLGYRKRAGDEMMMMIAIIRPREEGGFREAEGEGAGAEKDASAVDEEAILGEGFFYFIFFALGRRRRRRSGVETGFVVEASGFGDAGFLLVVGWTPPAQK